jgi:hypothetical protein
MSGRQLQAVLDGIPDTGEIVIRLSSQPETDELLEAWRCAHADADAALDSWRAIRSREAFATFRAAEDRADAAQDSLAARRSI